MRHDKRDATTGRYDSTPPCDCCGKPIGEDHVTDAEVCGVTDGPGFFLCSRKRCEARRDGLSVEARRALYVRLYRTEREVAS